MQASREIKIYLSDKLSDRFRRTAMETFGYGRGSITRAAEDAIRQWCDKREIVEKPLNPSVSTVETLGATERQPSLGSSRTGGISVQAGSEGSQQNPVG